MNWAVYLIFLFSIVVHTVIRAELRFIRFQRHQKAMTLESPTSAAAGVQVQNECVIRVENLKVQSFV